MEIPRVLFSQIFPLSPLELRVAACKQWWGSSVKVGVQISVGRFSCFAVQQTFGS